MHSQMFHVKHVYWSRWPLIGLTCQYKAMSCRLMNRTPDRVLGSGVPHAYLRP